MMKIQLNGFLAVVLAVSSTNAFAGPRGMMRELENDLFTADVAPAQLIKPKNFVAPFSQWNTNNGYCGEVSMIQAGMNQGQWMSQYNARAICGTGLGQVGSNDFCSSHGGDINYNAQFLLENPNPGDAPFASAGLCLANSRLSYELYDYSSNPSGMTGYKRYMSWVKSQVIAGNQVTIGVLNHFGSDSQYDHEVTVNQIGTNHDPLDPTYYGDDVLYFDGHSSSGGSSYTSGYTFDSLAKTREGANSLTAGSYSILIPGAFPVLSGSGGDGVNDNPHQITAQNYAFAVKGPADLNHDTLPIVLTLTGSTTNGRANSAQGAAGFNFENPTAKDCSNSPPASWMGISLKATVSGLTAGTAYNLYRYEFAGVSGVGSAAALNVPDSNFNAHANQATAVTHFTATAATYTQTIQSTSDKVIVFRCVKASAP